MQRPPLITLALLAFALIGCVEPTRQTVREKPPYFELTLVSNDAAYGRSEDKPINVGGMKEGAGHSGQRWFFSMLRGPGGEELDIQRIGACCWFKTPNGYQGAGALDKYKVIIPSTGEETILYLNSYEFEYPGIPQGFTAAVPHNKQPKPTP